MKRRATLSRLLLCLALAAAGGCESDVNPDMAYCTQAGTGARIIDVHANRAAITMQKGYVRKNGIIVGAAMDGDTPKGEFRVYPDKGKCVVTTYSDGKSATYRLKTAPQ